MLMRQRHWRDRLLALKASGVRDLISSFYSPILLERIWVKLFDLSQSMSASGHA
jgi:hypothetical protein